MSALPTPQSVPMLTKDKVFTYVHLPSMQRKVLWDSMPGDLYLVTGQDRSGRRFRRQYANFFMASSINVWKGSLWLVRGNKRHLIRRTTN